MAHTIRSLLLALTSLLSLSASALALDLRTTLMRAGLSPEALAAAGATSNQVEGIVADVEASNAWIGGQLTVADLSYATARGEVDRLSRIVASGTGTEQDVANLATAKTALASAEAAQAAALSALFTAGKADLSGGVQTALTTLRSNMAADTPIEFQAKERTDEEWLRLKRLLAHERVCAKTGETPDAESMAELATLRAEPSVALAKTSLEANQILVKATWQTATAD